MTRVIDEIAWRILPSTRILLYHRVTTPVNDPLNLAVSPENFRDQLKHIQERFRVISLSELVGGLRKRSVERGTIVITFDDGFRDNLEEALPILEEFKFPASFFLTAGVISKRKRFSWLPEAEVLRPEEVKTLAKSKLVTVGAHSLSHPRLSELSLNDQEKEISESKEILEQLAGKAIDAFAYPYGRRSDFTEKTVEILRETGFSTGLTTTKAAVVGRTNPYRLPRYTITNMTYQEFKKRLASFS